jgi:FMN hydrolase / 5-amino-6-(5-phospho-D-ribitylamino)uracil phosphatase
MTSFDPHRIRALSFDLDDTLWPIAPVIARAENALQDWLAQHAPMAAALFANPHAVHDIREQIKRLRPELKHDLSAIRREAIRLGLYRAGENPLLANEAFDVFFAERNRVQFYPDVREALARLGARFTLVALSNGNAQLDLVGLADVFKASLSASQLGFAKPDPRAFKAAAQAAACAPEEVLHVGDDISLDVLGARAAGLQSAWLNRADVLWPHPGHEPHVQASDLLELCDCLQA